MHIIIITLSIIGVIIGRKYEKCVINPIIVFNAWWLLIVLLLLFSDLMKINVYQPSNTAYQIVLVSLIGFNTTALIKTLFLNNVYFVFSHSDSNRIHYESRNNIVLLLSILVLLYSILKYRSSILGLAYGSVSLGELRRNYFESVRGGIEAYIISPIRYAVLAVTISDVIKKKIIMPIVIVNIANISLYGIASAGRFVIINLLYMCICAYLIYRRNNIVSFKQKIIIRILCGLIVLALIVMTSSRSTMVQAAGYTSIPERVLSSTVTYFAGGIIYIGILNKRFIISSVSKGYNFVRGFAQPWIDIIAILGIKVLPDSFLVINEYTNYETDIGPGITFNAFFTGPGYFYIDGGIPGVFLETALFAVILILVFDGIKRSKGRNEFIIAVYLLLFAVLCDFTTRWMLADPAYAYALIIIRLCYKKKRKNSMDLLKEHTIKLLPT